jgi:hypothetical protein
MFLRLAHLNETGHICIDLYLHQGRVYFGEMMLFDSATLREFKPDAVNIRLGDMIASPRKTNRPWR